MYGYNTFQHFSHKMFPYIVTPPLIKKKSHRRDPNQNKNNNKDTESSPDNPVPDLPRRSRSARHHEHKHRLPKTNSVDNLPATGLHPIIETGLTPSGSVRRDDKVGWRPTGGYFRNLSSLATEKSGISVQNTPSLTCSESIHLNEIDNKLGDLKIQ